MKTKTLLLLAVLILFVAGCTAGPNTLEDVAGATGDVAGFWKGCWHGLIAVFTWIISLFTEKVNIYEVHNNGGWYDFGFMLGIGAFSGGASRGGRKRSASRKEER